VLRADESVAYKPDLDAIVGAEHTPVRRAASAVKAVRRESCMGGFYQAGGSGCCRAQRDRLLDHGGDTLRDQYGR